MGSLQSNLRHSFAKYPVGSFKYPWQSLSEHKFHVPTRPRQGASGVKCKRAQCAPAAETGGSAVGTYSIRLVGTLQKYPPIQVQCAWWVIEQVKGGFFLKGTYWVLVGVNYVYVTKENKPCCQVQTG
jgi:hypothetical protein